MLGPIKNSIDKKKTKITHSMMINRRRAPSTQVSREKKMEGHLREYSYADIINGDRLKGTKKGDVRDAKGYLHSVKGGKKWQVFLYGYQRIVNSTFLNILQPCLDAFTQDSGKYFEDRIKCISFKEEFVKKNGRLKARLLSNKSIEDFLGLNEYVLSKKRLAITTKQVSTILTDKTKLKDFLGEALFNNQEVACLAIHDTTFKKDLMYKVFERNDVLDILTERLTPDTSKAGLVVEDYNVEGQKTLLRYESSPGKMKNIVEIEIRNDSDVHYREVRFNMYSKDTLTLLLNGLKDRPKISGDKVIYYGKAINFA